MARERMQIGEVARRIGLSLRTIRYYEEMGIVVPSARSAGGFRLYTEEDVARLELVKQTKPLDFSLEETRELLELLDALAGDVTGAERDRLLARLAAYHADAEERVGQVRRRLAMAEQFAAGLARSLHHQRS